MKSSGNKRRAKAGYLVGLLLFLLSISLFWLYFLRAPRAVQQIEFAPISDPLVNPLMGWAPWATLKDPTQPHTLVYADLTWRDFEPVEGQYDFGSFEQKAQLARWRREGQRVIFRFVLDVPGDVSHLDIPDWLYEKINKDGEFYDNQYGQGFSPNYANPELIKYHGLAIKALSDHYGRDGFFAFIELGSLGHWGEWHESPELMQLPSADIRAVYVQQYADAFPHTPLLMRRPFAITRRLNLGLYNDMTTDYDSTTEWLNWIAKGGTYLQEPNSLVPMPDGWQKAPVGGEQSPVSDNNVVYGTELTQTLDLFKKSHTTFVGPGGPYNVERGGPLQAGLDAALTTMGYRIYLKHAELPDAVWFGNQLQIKLVFTNVGIAPLYYNWPAQLFLFDAFGKAVKTVPVDLDLPSILPDELRTFQTGISVKDLPKGNYHIGLAILDPLTGKPAIRLANQNTRDDLIQDIGSFEIK